MKQFVKRFICGVLLVTTVCAVAGCYKDEVKTVAEERTPTSFRAIAATNASVEDKADLMVKNMSREDKIGQLILMGLDGTTLDEPQKEMMRKYRVGGILLDNNNMESKEQLRAFTKGIRDNANIASLAPPFIAIHRERMPYRPNVMIPWVEPNIISKKGLDAVGSLATRTSIEMRDLGFNLNLGPMVNTHSFYSYTQDLDRAAQIGELITKRYAANQVFTAYQFFPGGADFTVPGTRVDVSKDALMDDDTRVFVQLIQSTAQERPMIMVNSVKVTSMDAKNPVSLSKPIITDWLRGELGFTGVVLSDDIEVGAAITGIAVGDYAVRTIKAGGDMVAVCKHSNHIKEIHTALTQAVKDGTITEAELNAAVRRIMIMKFTNNH